MPAPVASGWSGRRVGLAPTGKAPPCHGARGERSIDAVWSYEAPYAAVAGIKDHLAFYPDRVDGIEVRA
jgi:hypothetical protein